MAFKKRETSSTVNQAKVRLAGMKKIDTDRSKVTDYGSEEKKLTVTDYEAQIAACEGLNEDYNQVLQQADALGSKLDEAENKLAEMSTSVLSSGKGKFGGDSLEYEQLGGKRISDRKKPERKAKETK
ncbi:MAG: hypothetical protein NTX22_01065 [Ignavibacteriales bacterium]|nr:hypothetical protein [Ignavibacteriales bacterium]